MSEHFLKLARMTQKLHARIILITLRTFGIVFARVRNLRFEFRFAESIRPQNWFLKVYTSGQISKWQNYCLVERDSNSKQEIVADFEPWFLAQEDMPKISWDKNC